MSDRKARVLSGLMEVLAFVAGRTPVKEFAPNEEPAGLPRIRGNSTLSAVEFENGDVLVCVAFDEGDYSPLTPGDGVQMAFYALTPQ